MNGRVVEIKYVRIGAFYLLLHTYRDPQAVILPSSMCIEYLTDFHWP